MQEEQMIFGPKQMSKSPMLWICAFHLSHLKSSEIWDARCLPPILGIEYIRKPYPETSWLPQDSPHFNKPLGD